MALVTGTPIGSLEVQEDIYLESAPNIYFQDYNADPLNNPDGEGYYWGLSGTTAYPAYEIGCPSDVSMTEGLTMTDVMCDNVGVKDTVQSRDYLDLTFTVKTLFPFQTLRLILQGSAVDETSPTQKFGLGSINNDQFYMVYCPKVYNTDVGDYVMIHLHRAKFVDAWTINMPRGDNWNVGGLKFRAFADTAKPDAQKFAVFLRSDLSEIP